VTIKSTWTDFKSEANKLVKESREKRISLLFRGQGNSSWDIETTLERSLHNDSVVAYFNMVLRLKSEIETFSGLNWDAKPDYPEVEKNILAGYDTFSRFISLGSFPHYAYLLHLRHLGFPSPLLDWTRSPFVAAYFAFSSPPRDASSVAIYAFRERGENGMKTGGSSTPNIVHLGPFVSGPKRHFAQQAEYTICTAWQNGAPEFVSHSNVCHDYDPAASYQQDVLQKFTIDVDERDEVMRELSAYNLTAYSLFGSEESLVLALSQREECR
jgi:hypothetical protein